MTALLDENHTGCKLRRRVRVMLLSSSLHYGGAERQIVELARNMDRSRFEPMLCCLDGRLTLADGLNDVPVLVLKKHHRLDVTLIPRLWRVLRDRRIDVVHTFLFDADILGRVAGRLAGVSAVIASERNSAHGSRPIRDRLLELTRPCFDAMIANSHAGKAYSVRELHTPERLVHVVHNGVDAFQFHPHDVSALRESLRIPESAPVVGMFASYKQQKNHAMYVRVAGQILSRLPETRFLFVAHKPSEDPVAEAQRHSILKQIESAGIGDRCVHLIDRHDVEDLYCLCNVTVLTSVREGTPNVVLESLASGVPVVATDVSDNAAILGDGLAGHVVRLNDDAAMMKRVLPLLTNANLQRRMGAAARERTVSEFSLTQLARKTERVYLETLDRNRNCGLQRAGRNGTC